ncbi:MAG: hypothetical protein WCP03_00360 [Candidatus Saccharibacteria bacterium]
MKKTKVYGIWHRIKGLSLVTIVILFIASLSITILSLRTNNLNMIKLRQTVFVADKQNADINTALNNLRKYVYSHMNTNLRTGNATSEPPIQLVNQFNRDIEAERQRIVAMGSADKVYVDAQTICEKQGVPIIARAQCIQDYVTKNGKGIPQLNLPAKEVYTFDFASPLWSPDIAGLSLIMTVFLGLMLVSRLIAGYTIKKYLSI